jgi:hypothetical protein
LGIPWELDGNTFAVDKKNQKKVHSPTPEKPERKKKKKRCTLSLLIGCIKYLFPKVFVTIYSMG